MIITSFFRKLTKVSTNIINTDNNGISARLEMCKNTISTKMRIYQPIRKLIPCSPKVHYTCLTLKVYLVWYSILYEFYFHLYFLQSRVALHIVLKLFITQSRLQLP